MNKISWWRTSFGEEEIAHIAQSMRNECVSQGKVTEEFESNLSEVLSVEHVICVSSGSVALLMALMAIGIKPGDEVILPNRTWIATAHAVHILSAKVVLVDVESERPIIDADKIEERITNKTKCIIPVHMNGRAAEMSKIRSIARKHSLHVIEDAAQAIGSRNQYGQLGTQSDIGCFSLSVAKTITTGQGGFAVTNNRDLADRMRAIRTHGVESVKDPKHWVMPGFNFRFTDVLASIGIEQLKRLSERIEHLKEIYATYKDGLDSIHFEMIPVDVDAGEVPVYNEFLVEGRDERIAEFEGRGIEVRPFYPDLNAADYLEQQHICFERSARYSKKGIYMPSGPAQKIVDVVRCIEVMNSY